MHVSKNRLEGSLADTRLDKLLEKLELHLFTGTIELKAVAGTGVVDLRAGAVENVKLGTLEGDAAMKQARALDQGEYVVVQRVPDLTGALGSSAGLEGEVGDVPIAAIMRHCESHALTCSLIVVDGFDRGEIHYRAGDWPMGEARDHGFSAIPDPGLGLPHMSIASGDVFLECPATAEALAERLGTHLVDMEVAAVAQAAEALGLPWAAIKAVTDGADGESAGDFSVNLRKAERR